MRTLSTAMAIVAATSIGLYAVKGTPAPNSSDSSGTPVTPQMMSIDAFNSGLKHLNSGDKTGASLKPADQKKALNELPVRLSAPESLAQLLQSLDDTADLPEQSELTELFDRQFLDVLRFIHHFQVSAHSYWLNR